MPSPSLILPPARRPQLKAHAEAEPTSAFAPRPSSARPSSGRSGDSGAASGGALVPVVGGQKIERVALAWREAGRLKDLRIEELSFQLGQVGARGAEPGAHEGWGGAPHRPAVRGQCATGRHGSEPLRPAA
jgi:hypothetical protein